MVGPFSVVGAGARIQVGERAKGEDAKTRRKDRRAAGSARRVAPGLLTARAYQPIQRGEAFLFPGDIYLGAGGRRGPRFA